LKMSILGKANIGLVGLCTLYAVTAVADISVVTRPIDETTGGNWEGTYGSCYSVVPWAPRTVFPEYPIGPDFQSKYVAQYQITEDRSVAPPVPFEPPKDAQCISGPGKAYFDFRIFTAGDPELNPDGNAFVWGFQEPGVNKWSVAAGTQQWNACLNDFYPAGWDSDDVDFEPLSAEIKLTTGGNATVAFYLLSAETTCRSQDYTLFINDSPVANGNVKNLSIGKYLVFDIEGLPEEGSTIRLETKEITGGNDSTYCGIVQSELAENSFVNGIFVDGTDACAPPPPEAPSRTLGYWKNHPTVINGDFGGAPSLLPLEFCGKVIDDACDAVYFLKKGGGGKKKFMRQGMAALLNCTAFGCPTEISDLIAEASEACGNGYSYKYGKAGGILGDFNEANDNLPLPFKSPKALPKYCN
jgi:hypothetical protein